MVEDELFDTPDDPPPTQIVKGVLDGLQPGGNISAESPEASEQEEEGSNNISIEDVA